MNYYSKKSLLAKDVNELCTKYGISQLEASILLRRGIKSGEDIKYFIEKDLSSIFLHWPQINWFSVTEYSAPFFLSSSVKLSLFSWPSFVKKLFEQQEHSLASGCNPERERKRHRKRTRPVLHWLSSVHKSRPSIKPLKRAQKSFAFPAHPV